MSRPFPCCACVGCTDYDQTWQITLTNLNPIAEGYANRTGNNIGLFNYWEASNGIAAAVMAATPIAGWTVGPPISVSSRVDRRVATLPLGLSFTKDWALLEVPGGNFFNPSTDYTIRAVTLSNFRIVLSIFEEIVTGTSPTTTKKSRYVDAQLVFDGAGSGLTFTDFTTPEDTSELNNFQVGFATTTSGGTRVKKTNCSLPFVLSDSLTGAGKGSRGATLSGGLGGITIPINFTSNTTVATIQH